MVRRWKVDDSLDLYGLNRWGRDWVSVGASGSLLVGAGDREIDLRELVDEIAERGIQLPILLRFPDLLRHRLVEIHGAFEQAIESYAYRGNYRPVYPIKVNQNRFLVEDLVKFGAPFHHGLEAGSKPELLAVMALLRDREALVVCNGYKDREYVETALYASRLGPKVVLVIEKLAELDLILECSRRLEIRPCIGVRTRLSSRGAGHWQESGGDRSKFGLGAGGLVAVVERLQAEGMAECLELLHFHLGSQISSIRAFKEALREAAWVYVNLVQMGVPMGHLDVGGGLGIDYDGSQTHFSSSMNYTLQEYANDVVDGIMEVCDRRGVEHPTIVTESGRATVAGHAVLVFEILGVSEFETPELPEELPPATPRQLENLLETYRNLTAKNARESYHDALAYRDECLTLFGLGHLSLRNRVQAEEIFWRIVAAVRNQVRGMTRVPEELQGVEKEMADTYFANFSVFQSLPDSWAIDQLFPIVPIERLDEEPTRRAILADITCDSDGKIDRFIDLRDVRNVLELHHLREGEPYRLAVFLVGAYQEILGDLHNLFGDTHAVHVSPDDDHGYVIDNVIPGDTVTEVLRYVGFSRRKLVEQVRRACEASIKAGRMSREEARRLLRTYEEGLAGYTYLEG